MNLPAGLFTGLPKRRQGRLPVLIILVDDLSAVAPIHHMINRTRIMA